MALVLIADDNSTSRRILSHTLRGGSYDVVLAANGLEAFEIIQGESIDLAILDIDMPGMDGLTLLEKLRSDEQYNHVPLIMLTASGHGEDRLEALALGANEYLTKPVSSRDLLEIVNNLVRM